MGMGGCVPNMILYILLLNSMDEVRSTDVFLGKVRLGKGWIDLYSNKLAWV